MIQQRYIGTAMSRPIRLQNGRAGVSAGFDVIQAAIMDILNTPQGERFMLPEYGSRLHELFFEPNEDVVNVLARQFIQEALMAWEPRVTFVDIETARENEYLAIYITVMVVATGDVKSFVYPFYTKLIY